MTEDPVAPRVTAPPVHLLRPVPPWRESRAWCGQSAAGLAVTSAEEFAAICRQDDGRGLIAPRAACRGCRYAAGDRRADWARDPAGVIGLDCGAPLWEPWRAILRPELRALATLAARHRKEFRALLESETVMEALADDPGRERRT